MELSDSICRVCMQKGEKIIISSDIIFMIHFCAQISDHERLPKGVCEQCHENLHVAYRFRTTCEESNDKFWELLGQLDEEGLGLSFDAKNEGSTKRETEEVMEILEVVEEQLLSPKVEEYEGSSQETQKIRDQEEILANEEQSLTLNDMQLTLPPDGNKVPTEEVSMNTELQEEKGIIKRRGRPRKSPHVVAECVAKVEKIAKPFQCSQCGRAFSRQKILNRHEKSHSDPPKERSRKLRVRRLPVKLDDGQRPCKFCKEIFPSRQELNEHMNELHTNERPYLCSECGLRFIRNDYLVIHLRRHKGEKPYTCRFCGKGFPRATDLTVHERYHTGEKTHLCTVCGKGFHRAYNLLVHTRVHTGEKPYQCPHCDKSFAQGNDLKAHVRRHTGERFKCDVCNEGFIQGYHLTQHKRQVHGIIVTSHIRRLEKFLPERVEMNLMPAVIKDTPEEVQEVTWEQSM